MNTTTVQTIATEATPTVTLNDTSWLNSTIEDIQLHLFTVFGVPRCEKFVPLNHTFFQLANVFFLLSYFATYSKCGILYLRCMLLIGCVFFGIWGYEILCTLDALLWNLLFIIANTIHIVVLLFKQWPVRFSGEVEDVSKLMNILLDKLYKNVLPCSEPKPMLCNTLFGCLYVNKITCVGSLLPVCAALVDRVIKSDSGLCRRKTNECVILLLRR